MRRRRIRKLVYDLRRQPGPAAKAMLQTALAVYGIADRYFLRRYSRPDLASEKILLRQQKILFVGVPKVATRSLISALTQGERLSGSAEFREVDLELLLRNNPEIASFFKFTFVRNPWSRATSCYRDKVMSADAIKRARHLNFRPGLEAGMPFDAFAEWLNTPEGSDDVADRHWMSQHRILFSDRPDLISYDFIGRFERLADDYREVARRTGIALPDLPHKLKTQSQDQYKKAYTDRTIELIARRYARDIELFGYDFDSA